jgi:hypothetical protein
LPPSSPDRPPAWPSFVLESNPSWPTSILDWHSSFGSGLQFSSHPYDSCQTFEICHEHVTWVQILPCTIHTVQQLNPVDLEQSNYPTSDSSCHAIRVTIDRFWIDNWIYCTLLQLMTKLYRLISDTDYCTVTLLGSNFQWQTLLCSQAHVPTGQKLSHTNLFFWGLLTAPLRTFSAWITHKTLPPILSSLHYVSIGADHTENISSNSYSIATQQQVPLAPQFLLLANMPQY